jgi:phospho-N-acetylmuramoyl-pentapeptide-transferase
MYLPQATLDVIKIFTLGTFSFIIAFLITPFLTCFLYKYKLWRKQVREKSVDGGDLPIFQKFNKDKETNTPRMGGMLIWITVLITVFLFWFLSKIFDLWWINKLNFLSRDQTWLPLFALISASLLGLVDDLMQVFETSTDNQKTGFLKKTFKKIINGKKKYIAGGLSLSRRIFVMSLIGLTGGWWFFAKLGWSSLYVPGLGDLEIGFLYIPLFVFVMLATYSGGVIDGLDGLSGGVFASIFASFAVIALFLGQVNTAAFCVVILGALLAFLWFNIPPARFYMGESGMMGLCAVLTVVAFLTDSVLILPIIGLLLMVESGSVIVQLISKKIRKKKVFLSAPIHHHLEAIGWPHYKITMRFWIIGAVMAIIGIIIRLLR